MDQKTVNLLLNELEIAPHLALMIQASRRTPFTPCLETVLGQCQRPPSIHRAGVVSNVNYGA